MFQGEVKGFKIPKEMNCYEWTDLWLEHESFEC